MAPSILSADFGKLNEEIGSVEDYADIIHVDVMDGHFVPNITIGPAVVRCIKTDLPLDVHLMIENPEKYINDFAKAGSDRIIIHQETVTDLDKILEDIKDLQVETGVCLKPATPAISLKEHFGLIDEILVMTVEPGFGGQAFMPDMVPKIIELRDLGFKGDIAVDGGINAETAKQCIEAGANIMAAGSYIFKAEDRIKAIESLRG